MYVSMYVCKYFNQVFIALDGLSCRCFHEVNQYVKDSLNSKKKGNNKKRVSESSGGNEKKKTNNGKGHKAGSSNASVDDDNENEDDNDNEDGDIAEAED